LRRGITISERGRDAKDHAASKNANRAQDDLLRDTEVDAAIIHRAAHREWVKRRLSIPSRTQTPRQQTTTPQKPLQNNHLHQNQIIQRASAPILGGHFVRSSENLAEPIR
jgi:hypothetical protein